MPTFAISSKDKSDDPKSKKRRANKMVQALRKLGYAVTLTPIATVPAQG
jgi:hypothetical protein